MPEYELTLRDYIRIFNKRRIVIVSTFAIIFLINILYAYSRKALYQTSTTIKFQAQLSEQESSFIGVSNQLSQDKLTSQIKVIESRQVVQEAAKELKKVVKEK